MTEIDDQTATFSEFHENFLFFLTGVGKKIPAFLAITADGPLSQHGQPRSQCPPSWKGHGNEVAHRGFDLGGRGEMLSRVVGSGLSVKSKHMMIKKVGFVH